MIGVLSPGKASVTGVRWFFSKARVHYVPYVSPGQEAALGLTGDWLSLADMLRRRAVSFPQATAALWLG